MKHLKRILVSLIVFASCYFLSSQAMRNPSFIHQYDPSLGIERTFPEINVEEKTVDESKRLSAKIYWFKEYNSAIVKVTGPEIYGFNEGEYENAFFEYIQTWIQDPNHRYYSFRVQRRKTFHNRQFETNEKMCDMEFQILLYK